MELVFIHSNVSFNIQKNENILLARQINSIYIYEFQLTPNN